MNSFVEGRFYGKYRGVVKRNVDSEHLGRICAEVLDVLGKGEMTTWAIPCLPLTGSAQELSGMYMVPPIDTNVWIEFEHGDVNYPIWTGCYWTKDQVPKAALEQKPEKPPILLQSIGQNSIMIGGDPNTGITISCGAANLPASPKITLDPTGITLSVGPCKIKISSASVSINDGALEISVA
jgi:hypothetical protein